MKWFKLDSDFYNDNRVMELKATFGNDGLALYIHLLAMMAEQWSGKSEQTFVILKQKLVQNCFKTSAKFNNTWPKLCSIFGITYEEVGLNYHILYPKFLKKQASYFRGATTKNKISRGVLEIDKEVEVEVEKNILNTLPATKHSDTDNKKAKKKTVAKANRSTKIDTHATWEAFIKAYEKAYSVKPIRNATVNAQMLNFVKRVGIDLAPEIAKFYLTHKSAFYVKNCHKVGLMLNDAEKLATEFGANEQMTSIRAYEIERRKANSDAFDRGFEMYEKLKDKERNSDL